jgi:sec-independent protein translocase protein TatA
MFGSLGVTEVLVVILVLLLLFGAKRIPALARGIGEGISNFRHALLPTSDASKHPSLTSQSNVTTAASDDSRVETPSE